MLAQAFPWFGKLDVRGQIATLDAAAAFETWQAREREARAVVNRPPLLLADEPAGCLDSATGESIIAPFKELQGGGLTIFMVTHDVGIASYAGRTVTLKDGRLVSLSSLEPRKVVQSCSAS